MPPETTRPANSGYHSNYYQNIEKYFPEPLGGSVAGSTPDRNFDIDTGVPFTSKDRMSHYQIEKDQRVHWDIIKHLKIALGR